MNKSIEEVVVAGTLRPDGKLDLDERPDLTPGRVTVVLRKSGEATLPKDDPFWQRMQAIWDAQNAGGHVPRSTGEIEAQQQEMREGWARRQDAIEQLQSDSRHLRQAPSEPQS